MHALIESLIAKGPVVTDGSWGTQLQQRGLQSGQCPDSWNLRYPDRVQAVARQYVEAGSRIILTNTFGASRPSLERHGLADKTVEINTTGVEISKKAAGDQALVFASIGPCGKMLLTGEISASQLRRAFEEQATALAAAGADGIVVETMFDLEEAKIAATAAVQTGLPVIASMVFDSGSDKDMTMMGNSPEEAVSQLASVGVDGIGANCGQGIEAFVPICRRMRQATDLALWMKANAGLPEITEDNRTIFRTTAQQFAEFIPALVAAGANFIGACCGSDEGFIREICRVISRS